jgi:glycosyltransferase involved in cell wall biosynthesis
MKIAHLVDCKIIGGVERYFTDFVSFNNNGVKHSIITKSGSNPLLAQKLSSSSEFIYSLRHIGNIKLPKYLRSFKEKYVISKMKTIDPDLWLVWNMFPSANLRSNILNYKSIYYERGKAWWSKKILNKENKEFLDNVDVIICNSYASKRMLELKCNVLNKNIFVCHNALRPSCKPNKVETKSIENKKIFKIGIAGRQESFKGFPLVLHSLKILKKRGIPIKLYVAGTGTKLEELKKLFLQLQLGNDDVFFLGLVNDMKQFYSKIDLFICPSLREPFGLVTIEAMAHGCPVIVAGVDGLYEVVKDTNAGFIIQPTTDINYYPTFGGSTDFLMKYDYVYDPFTDSVIIPKFIQPSEIADEVERLWNNPIKFEEMSSNAIESVNKKFDYNKYLENINIIINKLIKDEH